MTFLSSSQNSTAIRFHWVDALRGVAALAIVVFHYHHFYLSDAFDRPSIPPTETFPYASIIWPLYSELASKAVELFWLISGFVFAHVYLPRKTSAWEFCVARFARLYPLHFATLIYVSIVQVMSLNLNGHWQIYGNNDARHFILQLFMSSNWTTWSRGLSYNGPIWSVSFEIVVYAMFFIGLSALRRKPMFLSLALCGASWAFATLHPIDFPVLRNAVFLCAGYFFLGTLIYTFLSKDSYARIILVLLLGMCALIVGNTMDLEHLKISGAAVVMLSAAVGLDRTVPHLGRRLSQLGDISYSIYLVHVPLQMTVLLVADLVFDGTRSFANSYLTLPVYVALSILLAHIAHKYLERPVGKFIRARTTSLKP